MLITFGVLQSVKLGFLYLCFVEELLAEKDQVIARQEQKINALSFQLAQLQRMIFGAKSERFVPASSPNQMSLDIESEAAVIPEPEEVTIEAHDRKKKANDKKHPVRMPFPAELLREEIILDPKEDMSGYKKIGEEITEELEYIEPKLFVRRFIRTRFAKEDNSAVIIAPMPTRVIEKGLFGPKLITQLIVDKYVDHLPLYRQMNRFERAGIKLAASTLSDTIAKVCELMFPLYECLKSTILNADYIQVDETPIHQKDYHYLGRSIQRHLFLLRS